MGWLSKTKTKTKKWTNSPSLPLSDICSNFSQASVCTFSALNVTHWEDSKYKLELSSYSTLNSDARSVQCSVITWTCMKHDSEKNQNKKRSHSFNFFLLNFVMSVQINTGYEDDEWGMNMENLGYGKFFFYETNWSKFQNSIWKI